MRRCGRDVLHDPHEWMDGALRRDCDGRTRNEAMVGQLTVAELRAALDGEQDWALVAVSGAPGMAVVELVPGREKGLPVFMLQFWKPKP